MHKNILIAAVALILMGAAQASPLGLWKTIDDDTKKEKSLVRISESNGVIVGHIERLLEPEAKVDGVCDKCSDERKGQPIVGLNIIRNVKQNSDDASMWDGGDILDPKSGKVYKVRMKPIEGGQKLQVRGYIGAPLLGRTQIWQRIE